MGPYTYYLMPWHIGADAYEARRLVPPLIFVTRRHQRHAICSWRSYFWLHFMNPDSGNAAKMHCFGHALNLTVQDAVQSMPLICDVMQNLRDLSTITIVHGSAKRLATFRAVADGVKTCDAMTPMSSCPTRWTVTDRQRSMLLLSHTLYCYRNTVPQ